MNTTKTTMFFNGGPWDGDESNFADPPDIVRVDGEMIAYYRDGKDSYRWGHHLVLTPAEMFAIRTIPDLRAPAPPVQKKQGFFLKFLKVLGTVIGINIALITIGSFVWLCTLPKPTVTQDDLAHPERGHYWNGKTWVTKNEPASTPPPKFADISAPEPGTRFSKDNSAPTPSRDDQIRAQNEEALQHPSHHDDPTPEVRRAEPVSRHTAANHHVANMPYGERIDFWYLGDLPNQAALPRNGNSLGDAYFVRNGTPGRLSDHVGDVFIWVAPNGGPAQWIDPVDFTQ